MHAMYEESVTHRWHNW